MKALPPPPIPGIELCDPQRAGEILASTPGSSEWREYADVHDGLCLFAAEADGQILVQLGEALVTVPVAAARAAMGNLEGAALVDATARSVLRWIIMATTTQKQAPQAPPLPPREPRRLPKG